VLGELIQAKKNLRSLSLQKVGLNDATASCMVEALVRARQLESLKLDFNKLSN